MGKKVSIAKMLSFIYFYLIIIVRIDHRVFLFFYFQCEISGEIEMVQRAKMAPRKLYWMIILIGGGHFAAAVFKGDNNFGNFKS